MAFCSGCGTEVGADVAFCPKCGKGVSAAAATTAPPTQSPAEAVSGIQENLAGLLCYALGWVSGLIFFLIDKRPFVRFHAMQSMMIFGAIFICQWIFLWSGFFGGILGYAFVGLLGTLLGLAALVCWILCMVKAFQNQRFKLPVIGDLAEQYSK